MSNSASNQASESAASMPFPKQENTGKPSSAAQSLMEKWQKEKALPSAPKSPKPPSLDSATIGTQSPVQRHSFEITAPKTEPERPKNKYTQATNIIPEHPRLSSMSIDDLSEAIQPTKTPIPARSTVWQKVTRWLSLDEINKKTS